MNTALSTFIKDGWQKSRRTILEEGPDCMFALPFEFVPPTDKEEGMFPFLCYWDTYFTNIGLLLDGETELAKNNCDDMAYLIEKLGYMPNAAGKWFANRSQFPVYALAVWDVFKVTGDKDWLLSSLKTIEKEYFEFWMGKRVCECGLNYYDECATQEEALAFCDYIEERLKLNKVPNDKREETGRHYLAEAESGWDFNQRFSGRCKDFIPVDLNAILYRYETIMYDIYEIFGNTEKMRQMQSQMENRKKLMKKYLYSESLDLYCDYDRKEGKLSEFLTCANFLPYFAGVENKGNLSLLLEKLECRGGLFSTEKSNEKFQWGYPNVWPNLVFFGYVALLNCNMQEDGKRVANKFLDTVSSTFEKTGYLWEKYDGEQGAVATQNEYGVSKMYGWTSGVTKYFLENL